MSDPARAVRRDGVLFLREDMMQSVRMLAAAVVAAILTFSCASAQQPQSRRVTGTIERVDGRILTVKTGTGEAVKVRVTEDAKVFGVVRASVADIKVGSFVGVGAMPQPDGSQKAIRVMIFPESQRGTGEGHRPWVQPGSTMTNATVETTVSDVSGQVLTVKYRGGEKKIVIPPGLAIFAYVEGDRAELKPGVAINIIRAETRPDGMLEASRVNVGRGGVVPQ